MKNKHIILFLAFLLPMLSIFGASNIETTPMSGKAKLDSIIRSTGYAAFNLFKFRKFNLLISDCKNLRYEPSRQND